MYMYMKAIIYVHVLPHIHRKMNLNSSILFLLMIVVAVIDHVVIIKGDSSTSDYVCEHETLRVECDAGKIISVTSALYGRQLDSLCTQGGPTPIVNCAATTSLEVVGNICNGKQTCNVAASNVVFGDPCVGTFKYLQIDYSCEDECNELTTDDQYYYRYNPSTINTQMIEFEVKANNDAHIALASAAEDAPEMYEIVISGWGNTQSVIRRCKQCTNQVAVSTRGYLSTDEIRGFWISYDQRTGLIKVGKKGEAYFMRWQDPNPLDVKYLGYSTGWGSAGVFRFCNHPDTTYLGCYIDDGNRALPNYKLTDADMTQELCFDHCRSFGNQVYAGLQYSSECWCGGSTDHYAKYGMSENGCNAECAGNSQQICGGTWRMSVFYLGVEEDDGDLSPQAIASIVASLFALLVLITLWWYTAQKKKQTTVSRDGNLGRLEHINAVYVPSSDTASSGAFPPPPGPGVNTCPLTPPAGYVPGYCLPGADAPPAYETLGVSKQYMPSQLGADAPPAYETLGGAMNPEQPSPLATIDSAYPPPLPSMATHPSVEV